MVPVPDEVTELIDQSKGSAREDIRACVLGILEIAREQVLQGMRIAETADTLAREWGFQDSDFEFDVEPLPGPEGLQKLVTPIARDRVPRGEFWRSREP